VGIDRNIWYTYSSVHYL